MGSNFYIVNGTKKPLNEKHQTAGKTVIYEVIRIISSTPLFFSEHYSRMVISCNKLGSQPPVSKSELLTQISNLCKINSIQTGNIKVEISISENNPGYLLYFIPHTYPTAQMYNNGVEVGFLFAERKQPNIKTEQPEVRERANALIKETNFFEVLLINSENKITEGSRSNIFFILENRLITSPLSSVLIGVTLSKILFIANKNNIDISYKNITIDELSNAQSIFLTGTSPKILPIVKTSENIFDVKHPILQLLMTEYDKLVKQDIEKTRRLIKK